MSYDRRYRLTPANDVTTMTGIAAAFDVEAVLQPWAVTMHAGCSSVAVEHDTRAMQHASPIILGDEYRARGPIRLGDEIA
jgi:hypothetical protein